jgi:hypothetical protein
MLASKNCVFIARGVNVELPNQALCAVIHACAAYDSTVVTDYLTLNPQTNEVNIPSAANAELAEGCYQALRILGGNYAQVEAGDLFAYAMVRGVHSIVTVAGHSDEGSLMRKVLRTGRFEKPYGGIASILGSYMGFPRPANNTVAGWQNWVDSIALSSAAAVAVSDPCVVIGGRVYPTVLSNNRYSVTDPLQQIRKTPPTRRSPFRICKRRRVRLVGCIRKHWGVCSQ